MYGVDAGIIVWVGIDRFVGYALPLQVHCSVAITLQALVYLAQLLYYRML